MSEPSAIVVKTEKASSASDGLGITKAVFDLVNTSNPINQIANGIIKWLGRECISESDFTYCLSRTRELAFPNERGLEIRHSIDKSIKRIVRAGGMQLITAGSVGRYLAFSREYAYMVTTAAALLADHGPEFVVKALCEMVLVGKGGALDGGIPYPQYSVERARLQSVLGKIVDSILLNVSNCGHSAGELPEVFKGVCTHLTDANTYATFVMRIAKSTSDLLIACDRFQGDLLLWVMNHFEGTIEVSIAGKLLSLIDAPHSSRKFIMIVREKCQPDCRKERYRIEMSELLGASWVHVLDGLDDPTRKTSPAHRIALYTIESPSYSRRRDILSREARYETRILAQRFLLWLLDLSLTVTSDLTTIGFEITFDCDDADAKLRVADVLCCSPALLHDKKGQKIGTLKKIVFKAPKTAASQPSDAVYERDLQPISELFECFPAILELDQGLQKECRCRVCRNGGSIDDAKEGCLREAALNQFLVLIGNAIADGFGIRDIAGCTDLDEYALAVRKILWNLIEGRIWWDDWFNVSGSTALGYSPRGVLGRGHINEGGNALVAIQYGSMVIAAKWLDLKEPIAAKGCFSADVAEGQIPSVQEQCAFLFTEVKLPLHGDVKNASSVIAKAPFTELTQKHLKRDECEAVLDHAIIGTLDGQTKRLLTTIKSGSARRIIDPSDTLLSILRSTVIGSENRAICKHRKTEEPILRIPQDSPVLDSPWHFWTFEQIVANWESGNNGLYVSTSLDSNLKLNVALSLSADGCLLRDTLSCQMCAAELLHESTTLPGRMINHSIDTQALSNRVRTYQAPV